MSQQQMEPTDEAPIVQLPICAKLVLMAQRELAAFLSAVVSLFGSEQASLAADAWITELMSLENVIGFACKDWRLVTIGALSRLAHHLVTLRKVRMPRSGNAHAKTPTDPVARWPIFSQSHRKCH